MSSPNPHHQEGPGSQPPPLLSEFQGDADMAELIEFFVDELKDRVSTIESAWQTGDERRLREMAHQLKGAASSYGYPDITHSAAELEGELLAEQAELSSVAEKVEDLVSLCRRAAAGGSC